MSDVMVKIDRPYVQCFNDRHGRERLYYRRAGEKRLILRGPLGSDEFENDYRAARLASSSGKLTLPAAASPQTYKWLCLKYFKSADFLGLDPQTQRTREGIIEHTWAEPVSPDSSVLIGDCPLDRFNSKIVRVLRDRKARACLPHAANGRMIAFALLRYLRVRRSDVVCVGYQHVRDGRLRFTTKKCPTSLELPIPVALQPVLDASKTGDLTYLLTEYGKSFTAAGFGNWFREQCNAAGLPQCSAHGLRKAAATALADRGATAHQLMAWFGWRRSRKRSATRARRIVGDSPPASCTSSARNRCLAAERRTNCQTSTAADCQTFANDLI